MADPSVIPLFEANGEFRRIPNPIGGLTIKNFGSQNIVTGKAQCRLRKLVIYTGDFGTLVKQAKPGRKAFNSFGTATTGNDFKSFLQGIVEYVDILVHEISKPTGDYLVLR